mgnify:FL=1
MFYLKKGKTGYSFNSDIGLDCFCLGTLFLASAPFLSCFFFLYPLFKGILNNFHLLIKDRFNQLFILISSILIIKSLLSSFFPSNQIESWDPILNWAGIANWIPLFICFMGFNQYLDKESKREQIAKYFIIGTIPVLVSCIGQFWFKWYGPFETLNGLIIWFQRPLTSSNQNVTGLFSNPNYAGVWLTMMWPLSFALLVKKINIREYFRSKIMALIIIALTSSILLTNSRNAWIGFLLSMPFLYGKKSLKWYIPCLAILISIIFLSFLPFVPIEIRNLAQMIVPENVQTKISEITLNLHTFPRLNIWSSAIGFIKQKPMFGWGAGAFPHLYRFKSGFWNDHTHNLFLELSVSYGLLISILIFIVLITILIKSFYTIFISHKESSIIDKGWWVAGFIFFFSHLNDVLIYDIRINLASWIFLIGLKNIFYINTNELK